MYLGTLGRLGRLGNWEVASLGVEDLLLCARSSGSWRRGRGWLCGLMGGVIGCVGCLFLVVLCPYEGLDSSCKPIFGAQG